MLLGTFTRQVEKLACLWYVRTLARLLARGHVDHAGTYGTFGTRFSKLTPD